MTGIWMLPAVCKRLFITFLLMTFLLGAAFAVTRLIPAFQSPDETSHLLRADMLSHGQWLLRNADGGGPGGGYVDTHFHAYASWMSLLAGNHRAPVSASLMTQESFRHGWANQEVFADAVGTGYYMPLIYLPHATGLFLSRHLGLSMGTSYEFTRLLVTATALVLLIWAFKLQPPHLLTSALLLTPMSLFQLLSPSIDGLCTALACLIVALWMSLRERSALDHPTSREWLLYGCIFLLVTARTHTLPALLIPVVLLWHRPSRQRLTAVMLLWIACIAWIGFAASTTFDHRVVRGYSTAQIIGFYLSDPVDFFALLAETLANEEKKWFFLHSFFGILGWLDAPIPQSAVTVFSLVFAVMLAILALTTRWREAPLMRCTSLAISLSSLGLTFFALAVTWNDYPTQLIQGVQGRYFIIPAVFAAAALGPRDTTKPWWSSMQWAVLLPLFAYSLNILVSTLIPRYGMSWF